MEKTKALLGGSAGAEFSNAMIHTPICAVSRYNDFDIILDHFCVRFSAPPTPHALWAVFYLVPSLTSC